MACIFECHVNEWFNRIICNCHLHQITHILPSLLDGILETHDSRAQHISTFQPSQFRSMQLNTWR